MNNKAKKISDLWLEIAENKGSKFQYRGQNGWDYSPTFTPTETSDLEDWRVSKPPETFTESKGCWVVQGSGAATEAWDKKPYKDNFMTRKTTEQANNLSKKLKHFARMDAFAVENNSTGDYYIYKTNKWLVGHKNNYYPDCITMSEKTSTRLCEILNNETSSLAEEIMKERMTTSRMDIIGQNGNDGEHYRTKDCGNCKHNGAVPRCIQCSSLREMWEAKK